MALSLKPCLCVFLCLFVAAQSAKVTPVAKVISLLQDLSKKIAAEGQEEAVQYDKYACFCKEQADEKLYNIEKSEAKLKDLKAEIKELDTAIADLNSDLSELSKQISNLENEIKDKTEKRNKEHKEYSAAAKDMNEAIDACGAAIEALRASKKAMKGAKVNFVQVTSGLVRAVTKQPRLANAPSTVALLSKIDAKAAPKFEYQSNDIIATLEDLLATFKSMKKDLDIEEFDVNSAFEKNKLALSNEKKFAERDKAEKEAIVEAKTEQLEAAKTDRDEETADKEADEAFMKEVTMECETQAKRFDQRSFMRAHELRTLESANEILLAGAAHNYNYNKKLVGLQKGALLGKAAAASAAPVTFAQISSVKHRRSEQDAVLQRVRSFLAGAANRTASGVLSAIAMRVNVAEDHFVKVRALIKDLLVKLRADAKAEATQKGICDKGMAKAIADRDEANSKIEVANAKITTLTAKKSALEDEIGTLNRHIAELERALLEATQLRERDMQNNMDAIMATKQGAEAVKLAIEILQDFYKNKAYMTATATTPDRDGHHRNYYQASVLSPLVQTGKYVPPKSDREGNTVGDLAPEAFDSTYHGAQTEPQGIVGILEVILSDFERTTKQTERDDKDSKAAFDRLEKDTNDDVSKKNKRLNDADGELADAEADILDQQQALSDAKDLLESGLEVLEELEATCVKGEETWEERKKKREEEIEAMKEALTILEEWQGK